MLQHARTHLPIVITAVITGTIFAAAPTIAQAAYDAVNADKVDGKHAVSAGATVAKRSGKLVATSSQGRLPNNIIAKAPDADRLDGLDSTGFVQGTGSQVLSNRFVLTPGNLFQPLLSIPGLGRFTASCDEFRVDVLYFSPTDHAVDYWRNDGTSNDAVVLSAGSGRGVVSSGTATVNLGTGNLATDHRIATVEVSALQTGNNQPCGFQIQAIYSHS